MSDRFISAINSVFDDATEFEILDALWLARRMPKPADETVSFSPTDSPRVASELRVATLSPSTNTAASAKSSASTSSAAGGNRGSLYAGSAESRPDEPVVPVRPVRIPAGVALPQGLEMVRGFRPLPRMMRSRVATDLDEDATVTATVENGMRMLPLMRPAMERWFNAALVVEHTPSMEIWSQAVIELERMLQFSGVFHDVRNYWLHLEPQPRLIHDSGSESRIESLLDPQARRIIFLFSAGTSQNWTNGSIGRVLKKWSGSASVVLIHALPQSLWKNTNLGEPVLLVHNPTPGGSNEELRRQRAWWARRRVFEGERCVLPVFALDRASTQRWAQMVASRKGTTAPAFLVRTTAPVVDETLVVEQPLGARDRVSQFRGTASPEAVRLAVHLAPAPFTLAVLRLMQNSLLRAAAKQSQAAEVMLSGLVRRITAVGAAVPPDQLLFEFESEVRTILLESLRDDDARDMAQLMENYIGERIGSPTDFVVQLRDPEGRNLVPASLTPFAVVRDALAERLNYGRKLQLPPTEPAPPATKWIWPMQNPLGGIEVLWVDDHPSNNTKETADLERMGARVTTKLDTESALAELSRRVFQVIITDMSRGREHEAGLNFLGRLPYTKTTAPAIIYASYWTTRPNAQDRAKAAGAIGCTNSADELLDLVFLAAGRLEHVERYLNLMGEIDFDQVDALEVIRTSPEQIAGALAARAHDMESLYQVLSIALDAITGCDYVQVFLGAAQLLLAADHIGSGKERYNEASLSGVIGTAYSQQVMVYVPDVREYTAYIAAEKSTLSEAAIPISGDAGRVGVVNLESPVARAFSREQLQWLDALSAAYPFPRCAPSVYIVHTLYDETHAFELMKSLRDLEESGKGLLRSFPDVKWASAVVRSGNEWHPNEPTIRAHNCYLIIISKDGITDLAKELNDTPEIYRPLLIPVIVEACEIPFALRDRVAIDVSAPANRVPGARQIFDMVQDLRFSPGWHGETKAANGPDEQSVAAIERAREALNREDYDGAIRILDEAIRTLPNTDFYKERGLVNWYAHHFDASLADYNEALRLDRSLEDSIRFSRGQMLADAGRYKEAIEDLDPVVQQDTTGYAYRGRGVARAGLGDIRGAVSDFGKSRKLAPDNAWLYYSTAVAKGLLPKRAQLNSLTRSLVLESPRLNRPKRSDAIARLEEFTGKLNMEMDQVVSELSGSAEELFTRARVNLTVGKYGLALLQGETLRGSYQHRDEVFLIRCKCHRRLCNFELADLDLEEFFK